MAIAERGRTESWEKDHHAYGIVASFVFCNWASALSWGAVCSARAGPTGSGERSQQRISRRRPRVHTYSPFRFPLSRPHPFSLGPRRDPQGVRLPAGNVAHLI
jgi:hypothetical protein